MSEHSPPKKCPRIDVEEIPLLSKEELLKQCRKQQEQIEQLKIKLNFHAGEYNKNNNNTFLTLCLTLTVSYIVHFLHCA